MNKKFEEYKTKIIACLKEKHGFEDDKITLLLSICELDKIAKSYGDVFYRTAYEKWADFLASESVQKELEGFCNTLKVIAKNRKLVG